MMATVIEIVKAHLEREGFGGLVADGGECGCELDDLVPCAGDCSHCSPGYKHDDPRPAHEGEWAIWKQKDAPTEAQWDLVEY